MSIFALLKSKAPTATSANSMKQALEWAKRVYRVGAVLPSNVFPPSEETAGYIIPTFYQYGEKELAIELAKWETTRQRADGAFCAPDGVPYTFDTAQVIRGFLAVLDDAPLFEEPLRRACDYVESQIHKDGKVGTFSYDTWRQLDGSYFSDYCHLYVLPPLLLAGQKLSEPRYIYAVERAIKYFRRQPDLVEFKPEFGSLSHIFGYMMEGLVELGQADLAKKGLQQAAAIQKKNGAIPAYPGVDWVCSTGLAQLALAWYKLGINEPADKAVQYLESLQNPSGGFYGSYGKKASYLNNKEIGWGAKYYLDCCLLNGTYLKEESK